MENPAKVYTVYLQKILPLTKDGRTFLTVHREVVIDNIIYEVFRDEEQPYILVDGGDGVFKCSNLSQIAKIPDGRYYPCKLDVMNNTTANKAVFAAMAKKRELEAEKNEDIIISINTAYIHNGMKVSKKKFKTCNNFYLWEIIRLEELGYSPNDYIIRRIIPGLSDRSEKSLEEVSTYVDPPLDAYSICIIRYN